MANKPGLATPAGSDPPPAFTTIAAYGWRRAQWQIDFREYYPPELMEKESFVASLKRQVPAGRLGTGLEDAAFALFLASDESGFFAGQAFPFAGGWVQR
ncbi:MAG: hypothetical protein OXH09_12845 [Gammaproteobacteria bacterium]|nr:hypothetical protein [Gammaproteobacteria bacterium]